MIFILLFGIYPIANEGRSKAMEYFKTEYSMVYFLYLADMLLYLWSIVYGLFIRTILKPGMSMKPIKIFELLQIIPFFLVG